MVARLVKLGVEIGGGALSVVALPGGADLAEAALAMALPPHDINAEPSTDAPAAS